MTITTKNLKIVSCDKEILQAAITGNQELAQKLEVHVPDNWTEFGTTVFQYVLHKLAENDTEKHWWTYFPIHIEDNTLIGSGGYKGGPTENGTVEIGYEIAPPYRNRGFATEMVRGLIAHAFSKESVQSILAHTLGETNPSTSVLEKCGFKKIEEINDPDDGLIWKWELKRMPISPSTS